MANVRKAAAAVAAAEKRKNNTTNNSNKTSSATQTSTPSASTNGLVNTNTSYNGNFLSVDLNADYAAQKNAAIASGDYAAAAKAEAARNAKLEYLGRGNEATYDYIQVYDKSPTNNQGGTIYDNKINEFKNAPDDWSTLNILGANYKRGSDGRIYQESSPGQYNFVGDGVNLNTGGFTFSNTQDAAKAAYDKYIGAGGNKVVSQEYATKNLIDSAYIDALLRGDVGSYLDSITKNIKSERELKSEREAAAALSKKYGDVDNSFESESEKNKAVVTPKEEPVLDVKQTDAYRDYINSLFSGSRRYVY